MRPNIQFPCTAPRSIAPSSCLAIVMASPATRRSLNGFTFHRLVKEQHVGSPRSSPTTPFPASRLSIFSDESSCWKEYRPLEARNLTTSVEASPIA